MADRKTYSELLASKLKDKQVEIYIGDDTETLKYSDNDVLRKSVIRGIIKGAESDLLEVEVVVATGVRSFTGTLYLNGWCIKGVMEVGSPDIMTIFGNYEAYKRKR